MSDQENARIVDVFVRDRRGRPIPGASIEFTKDGLPAGGVPNAEGRGRIQLPNRNVKVGVTVTYNDQQPQTVQLGQDQDSFTFTFDVDVIPGWREIMERHLPLLVGLILFAVAIVLAFTFGSPTPLQNRIILGAFSLGGGAIATEISGMIKVDLNLGQKLVIGATGALAIFVILYLVLPA
jgi:hypothetical protein